MTCTDRNRDLVECARRGGTPASDLRTHLAECARCAERWEDERRLTDQFRTMRLRAGALMQQESDTQREVLMRDFAAFEFARKESARQRWNARMKSWSLATGMAAAVLLAVLVGHYAGTRSHPMPVAAGATSDGYQSSNDASELSSDDFIAVPYTPPLAQGELVRVVHADLVPEALASLGIDIDPSRTSNVPADLVVGEDGIPRAVRITDGSQF